MNRLAAIMKRHAAAGAFVLPAIVIVHALGTRAVDRQDPLMAGDVAAGPYPLLPAWAWFDAGLPIVGDLRIGALLLAMAAAIGFLLAAWRITRNRVVAAAAAFLYGSHPVVVAATHDAAGLRDVLLFLFVAWGLAIAARPRARSPRFPNRAPHPAPFALVAVFVVAAASTPFGWMVAPLMIAFDVAHGAREGRARRDVWMRGYAVHLAVAVVGVVVAIVLEPAPAVTARIASAMSFEGPSSRIGGAFTARFAGELPLVIRVPGWALLVVGVVLAALDALTGIGRRRMLIPHVAFCGLGLSLAALGPALAPEASPAPAVAIAAAVFSILLSALFWRVAVALAAERVRATPPTDRPTWGDVHARLALEALPPLVEPAILVPETPPAVEPRETPATRLASALERLRARPTSPRVFDAAAFDALVRPVAAGRAFGVVVGPAGSPWASALVVCFDHLMLVTSPGGELSCAAELDGVPGVRREDVMQMPWHAADAEADAVVAIDAFENLQATDVGPVLRELRRVLARDGRGVLAFTHDGEIEPSLVPEVVRQAGFTIDAVDDSTLHDRMVVTIRRDDS